MYFGIFNSSKRRTKKLDLSTYLKLNWYRSFFGRIGDTQDISKLADLYRLQNIFVDITKKSGFTISYLISITYPAVGSNIHSVNSIQFDLFVVQRKRHQKNFVITQICCILLCFCLFSIVIYIHCYILSMFFLLTINSFISEINSKE